MPQGFTGGQPGAHWPVLAECELAEVSTSQHTAAVLVGLERAAGKGGAARTHSGGPRAPTSDKTSDFAPPWG